MNLCLDATVVIPTRDRSELLARCLSALAAQKTLRRIEIVVVNDGSGHLLQTPVDLGGREMCVLEGGRAGPAAARNRGIAAARGGVILFTDDDTIPGERWVETALRFLDDHPNHVGVTGPTVSEPFDYLYEHSVDNRELGFWTCNIAYRRSALERLGGFFEEFQWAYCEDLDLGYRARRVGPIGFAPEMRVTHPPRRVTLAQIVGRGRYARSEFLVYTRHPDIYRTPLGMPRRFLPIFGAAHQWAVRVPGEGFRLLRSPRRLTRFVTAAVGQIGLATAIMLVTRLRKHP